MTYEELPIEERARLQQTGLQQGLTGALVMEFYNNPEEYGFYNLPEIEVTPQTNNSDRTYAILKSMSNGKELLGRLYNIFIEAFDNPTSDDTNIGFSGRIKRLGEIWDLAKRPKIIDTGNDWFENIANHFTTGFEKVPKYDNFGNTIILHDKGKAIIDELSHALQYKAFPNLKGEWSPSNFSLKRRKQLKSYEEKGNIENVAHTVILPIISRYIYSDLLPSKTYYRFLSNGKTPLEFMIDGFKELSKEEGYKWRKPTIEERRRFYRRKGGKLILRKYGIGGQFDNALLSIRSQLSKKLSEAAPKALEKLRYLNYLSPSVWIGTTARMLKGNTSGLHTLMMLGKGITTTAFAQSNPILDFLINFGVDMINPGNIITGAIKPLQLSGKIVNAASKIKPGTVSRIKSLLEHATEGGTISGIAKTLNKVAGLDKEYDRMLALKYIITGDREALKQLPRGYIGVIDKIRKDYTRGRYSLKPTDLLTLPELNLGVKDSVVDAQNILDELAKVESWLGKPIQIRDGVILGNKNILTNEKIQRLLDGVAVKGVTPVVGITKQQGNTAVKLLNEETPKLVYALDHFDIPGTRASGEAYNTGGMWNFVFKDKNGQYKIVYCDIFKHTDLRNKYIPKALSKMLNSFEKTPSVLLGVDKFSIKHATLHINNELKKRIPKILDAEKAGNIDLKEELIEECIDIIKRDISLFKYDFNECYRLLQSINKGTFYKSITRGLKPIETIKEKIVSKISLNALTSSDDKIKEILSLIFDGPDGANRFIFNTLDENFETKKRWTQTLVDYLYTDKEFFSRDGLFLELHFPNLAKKSQHIVDRGNITLGFNLDSLKGIKSLKIKGLQEIKRPYLLRTKAKQNTIYCITEYDPNRTDIIDAVLNDLTMLEPSLAFGYEFGVRYRKQYDKIKDGKIDPKELLTEEDLDIFNDRMLIWKEELAKLSETPEQILFWKLGGIIKILLN